MTATPQLDPRVATAFYGRFHTLHPAQEAALGPLLGGRDVVLSSGTGSGKTEAVLAPIVSRVWREASTSDQVVILYIAPTKALVNDLEKRLQLPLDQLGLRLGIRHGDRDDLDAGKRPHVLITTPESLDVMLFRHDTALATICAVVVDEVHLLYNTQRGVHLSILLKRLQKIAPQPLQYAALSATIADLSEVGRFLFGSTAHPECLSFPATRTIDAQIRRVADEGEFLSLVARLTADRDTKILIFANSRRKCEHLASILSTDEAIRGCLVTHYSSLSGDVRTETEHRFATARKAICIATSTLELGIDIGDIDVVILWDYPSSVESLLQRIGRGNRRSSKTNAVCLIPDDATKPLRDALVHAAIIDAARAGVIATRAAYRLFGAAAQQFLSVIASDGGKFTRIADLAQLVSHLPHIDRPVAERILSALGSLDYLKRHGFRNRYGAAEKLYELVDQKLIYGNFPASSSTVDLWHGSKCLGSVPALNLLRIRPGALVRFHAGVWRITKSSHEGILLQPARGGRAAIDFTYGGKSQPMETFIVDRVHHLLLTTSVEIDLFIRSLRDQVGQAIQAYREAVPDSGVPFFQRGGTHTYLTFAGELVNRAIGILAGLEPITADEWTITVPAAVPWTSLPTGPESLEPIAHLLFQPNGDQTIYQSMLPADLQLAEATEHWRKDETTRRVLSRLSTSQPVEIDPSILSWIV